MSWMLLLALGCAKPLAPAAAGERLAELERRVAALEAEVKELQARPPGAGMVPRAPDRATEDAAMALYEQAKAAVLALDYDTAKAALAQIRESYPSTRAFRASQRMEGEVEVVGRDEAPLTVDRWFQGSEGEARGQVATLLVFWEVWCPHCKREVPRLTAFREQYGDRGVGVVALTKQTRNVTDEQVTSFIDSQGLTIPVAREQGTTLSEHYGIRGIPAAAMVRDGQVVWRGHPATLSDELMERILE